MSYSNTHRRDVVVLAGNGPVLFHSTPVQEARHGLAAEQEAILLRAEQEEGSAAPSSARPRSNRVRGTVWQSLRSRLIHSLA